MKVLVIGSGGREHCLAWKIFQSPLVDEIYCAPGNGGTGLIAQNIDISVTDIEGLSKFAVDKKIDLTVVGPEAPLVAGIVDKFQEKGLKIFGPCGKLARLEGSKIFAKEMMKKYGIATAAFEVFDEPSSAKEYIKERGSPLVVKAEGLAAGKGVVVCKSVEQALEAVDMIMLKKKFGPAGERIVIEDYLEGEELSVVIFTDGETIIPLVSSQDHKPVFDGDKGDNTGGMGAYAPAGFVTEEMSQRIIEEIFKPLIAGLKKEGEVYNGMLYAGLMIRDNQPYVLEFNVRFGDPETQATLPKMKSDLVEVMLKTIDGQLAGTKLQWSQQCCLCVVLASGGYPGSYEKGKTIQGLEKLVGRDDVFVFHAGTESVVSDQSSPPEADPLSPEASQPHELIRRKLSVNIKYYFGREIACCQENTGDRL